MSERNTNRGMDAEFYLRNVSEREEIEAFHRSMPLGSKPATSTEALAEIQKRSARPLTPNKIENYKRVIRQLQQRQNPKPTN